MSARPFHPRRIDNSRTAAFIAFVAVLVGGVTVTYSQEPTMVRVLLAEKSLTAKVSSAGAITVIDNETEKRLNTGEISSAVFSDNGMGLVLNGMVFPVAGVRISSDGGAPLSLNGKEYEGTITVAKNGSTGINVVNKVDIETYLKGVVPAEMPSEWPMDALMAQAIAARSYTLSKMEETNGQHWDVTATVGDQVYGGKSRETERTNNAVNFTRGVTIAYKGATAKAFYHSTSGARTESGKNVFPGANFPYLSGVSCQYYVKSPYRNWTVELTYGEIETALRAFNIPVGTISGFKPKSFTPSGRVSDIELQTSAGKKVMKATIFRQAIGYSKVKSTWFRIYESNGSITLKGRGFGHGVGLCQWGAKEMAERNIDFRKILEHYYPGTELSPSDIPGDRLEGA